MEKKLHKLRVRQETFVDEKIFGYFYENHQDFIKLQAYKKFLGENRLNDLIFDAIWEKELVVLNNIHHYLFKNVINDNILLRNNAQSRLNYESIASRMYDYYFRTRIGWKKFVKRYNKWLVRKSKENKNE